jgi:hypothetical protein
MREKELQAPGLVKGGSVKPEPILTDQAVYAVIPNMGVKPTNVRTSRKDVKVIWDLGRVEVDVDGQAERLEVELWICDSLLSHDFTARLGQQYRTVHGVRVGSWFPYARILQEHRERFSPKGFRAFCYRAFTELDRRRQDPDVRAVFDPAGADLEGGAA